MSSAAVVIGASKVNLWNRSSILIESWRDLSYFQASPDSSSSSLNTTLFIIANLQTAGRENVWSCQRQSQRGSLAEELFCVEGAKMFWYGVKTNLLYVWPAGVRG